MNTSIYRQILREEDAVTVSSLISKIRYKTIDNCLRNKYRRWTLSDLVDACSDALYDMEGITKGVSVRTVQADLQIMRSDKLGYNAPIEVYDNKYYRYSDPSYSIFDMPLSENDYEVMKEAVEMLKQQKAHHTLRFRTKPQGLEVA